MSSIRTWATAISLILLCTACRLNGQPAVSPTAGTRSVPFTVVAHTGPPVGGATVQSRNGIYIFAAPSAQDLRGIVYASGDTLPPTACSATQTRPECWTNAPNNSLLIATFVAGGCGLQSDITDAQLSTGPTMTISATTKATNCPVPGSGTQPQAPLWLVAIPLDKLPAALLTVKVHGIAEGGARFATPDVVTTVDLRSPLDIRPTVEDRMAEAAQALSDVTRAARARIGPGVVAVNVAMRRWSDPGLGCTPSAPSPRTQWVKGYIVQMGTSMSGSLGEFHWAGSQTISC